VRTDVRKAIIASVATALAIGGLALVGCGPAHREALAKAEADARAKVNAYCDARAKVIEALGAAGAE
jgi:hypothetical protein